MNKSIEDWYRATRKLMDDANKSDDREKIQHMIQEWQDALETMEAGCPGIKEQYEMRKKVIDSFTYEQIDHICYMIGEWYMDWRDCITDPPGGVHKLGYAKEKLKSMICGD